MLAFLFPSSAPRVIRARYDLRDAWVNCRPQSWRERLNRAACAARSRVTLESLDIQHARTLRERAIRCAVYQENAAIVGKAVFS